MSAAELYDRDFYEWTLRNAELLRSGKPFFSFARETISLFESEMVM